METNFCPIQRHVEKAVSVEVVRSLEHVMISDGGAQRLSNNQEDSTFV